MGSRTPIFGCTPPLPSPLSPPLSVLRPTSHPRARDASPPRGPRPTRARRRYRARHIDLACNPGVRETFVARARLLRAMRAFLDARGFVEARPAPPPLPPVLTGHVSSLFPY